MEPEGVSGTVRFLLDGQVVCARDVPPIMTVLDYLREHLRRTGTKEGCAEGDCGACTVVLGEPDDAGGIRYRPINACIRLLGTIDGRELVTVESLSGEDGPLHPVQQAMVDQHASQCGFCTPGFVMSLFALYLQCEQPTRERIIDALSGNLCRCTGYRPIIDAGLGMGRYPAPVRWSRAAAHAPGRVQALEALARAGSLALPGWYAPRTVAELAQVLQREPGAVILAGGTDVGLWVTKHLKDPSPVVWIGEVEALRRIRADADRISIGAAVTLSDAWAALVAEYPALAEVAERFGSPPVRNSGTLCGNLANGSPIGDSMPALIALGAELELRRGDQVRRLPLERFYLGYGRKDLAPAEFITAVNVPRAREGQLFASYKVARRYDQDISAVCLGMLVELQGGRVSTVRIAYGGMAAVPARAAAAEAALRGKPWEGASIDAAAAALASDFSPLTDLRASSAYRIEVAGNLLRRFHREVRHG